MANRRFPKILMVLTLIQWNFLDEAQFAAVNTVFQISALPWSISKIDSAVLLSDVR